MSQGYNLSKPTFIGMYPQARLYHFPQTVPPTEHQMFKHLSPWRKFLLKMLQPRNQSMCQKANIDEQLGMKHWKVNRSHTLEKNGYHLSLVFREKTRKKEKGKASQTFFQKSDCLCRCYTLRATGKYRLCSCFSL